MSRGFKKDLPATEAAHFSDGRSFISLPKIIEGECTEPKPHLVLYGKDIGPMRAEIFRLNREENGGVNRCSKCNRKVYEGELPRYMHGHAEWHHIRHASGTRCDCAENGVVLCATCHSTNHVQVRLRSGKIMKPPEELC